MLHFAVGFQASIVLALCFLVIVDTRQAGCCRYKRTSVTNDTITYSAGPDGVRYNQGATVGFSCPNGPVLYGADVSHCSNGKWTPRLGRCAKMCRVEELRERGFTNPWTYPNFGKEWLQHKEVATVFCPRYYIVEIVGITRRLNVTCVDGKWEPDVRCAI